MSLSGRLKACLFRRPEWIGKRLEQSDCCVHAMPPRHGYVPFSAVVPIGKLWLPSAGMPVFNLSLKQRTIPVSFLNSLLFQTASSF